MSQTIQAGSPSLRDVYEECPKRAFLRAVKKIPEPERPPLANGKEYPNDRGSRLHDEAEAFVKGERDLPRELEGFYFQLHALRDHFMAPDSTVITEELWAFDEDWEPLPPINGRHQWDRHWIRLKIDAFVMHSPQFATVVDYKTGKRSGNEIKHGDQVLEYAIASFMKYPTLEEIEVELWYFDQDEIERKAYTYDRAMRFLPRVERRYTNMLSDSIFEPQPSKWNCRFCPYKTGLIGKLGPEGTGHCDLNPI